MPTRRFIRQIADRTLAKRIKRICGVNIFLIIALMVTSLGDGIFLASVVSINEHRAKSFDGSIQPLAFVPNWRVGNYIENRGRLRATDVARNDYIPLPDHDEIHSDFNSHFTYMNLHMGSYMDEDRVQGAGSHVGVDIRAPIGSPVFSIGHGIVYRVKDLRDEKYVVVKHKDVSYMGTVGDYYSAYLHLKEVEVDEGDLISKGTIVGTVGMTGITSTPHLHFQIDNDFAPFHPYWPFTLSEAYEAGYDFFSAVNNGLNQSQISSYTVDPLHFLTYAESADNRKKTSSKSSGKKTIQEIANETVGSIRSEEGRVKSEEKKTSTPRHSDTPTRSEEPAEKKEYYVEPKKETKKLGRRDYPNMNINSNKDEFPDLPRSHPYYGPIHYFTGKKVLSGYEDGTFGPDNTLTRSELLAVVLRALDLEYDGEILVGIFKDVPKDHWVNPLINNALDRRIITADRPVFEPNRPVTRSEFLAILVVASQIDVDVDDVTKVWSDVSETHWSAKYAKVAYKYKLFSKLRDDTFGPNNSVTRGEVANAMYQFLFQTKNR